MAEKLKLFRGRIAYFPDDSTSVEFRNGYLLVDPDGKIVDVGDGVPDHTEFDVVDYTGFLIIPGFFDIHIHLPQFDQRGRWATNLLQWLERYIFPAEMRFQDESVARDTAHRFFRALLANGTTTVVVYSSAHRRATEIAFEEAEYAGIRALIGQVMMDMNAPSQMLTTSKQAVRDVESVASQWHGKDNRLFYVVTPRFAVSCSMELMKALAEVASGMELFIQSHLSEQLPEIETVKRLFPEAKSYTHVYLEAGLLTERTIMAHAIYLSDEERKILHDTGTKIAHCPSSNYFLHSGTMDLQANENAGLTVGLGTDVGGGPHLSMFHVMREMYYANPISPVKAFYHATFAGAKVLGWQDFLGTLEVGKEADFIVINYKNLIDEDADLSEILAKLMFIGDDRNIVATYVRGRKVWPVKP